jgi:hypothetical protein
VLRFSAKSHQDVDHLAFVGQNFLFFAVRAVLYFLVKEGDGLRFCAEESDRELAVVFECGVISCA